MGQPSSVTLSALSCWEASGINTITIINIFNGLQKVYSASRWYSWQQRHFFLSVQLFLDDILLIAYRL
jgi:hypothetical protein